MGSRLAVKMQRKCQCSEKNPMSGLQSYETIKKMELCIWLLQYYYQSIPNSRNQDLLPNSLTKHPYVSTENLPRSETCQRSSAAALASVSSRLWSATCCRSSSKYFCSVKNRSAVIKLLTHLKLNIFISNISTQHLNQYWPTYSQLWCINMAYSQCSPHEGISYLLSLELTAQ